jgi:sarcosine oxidase, subunit delta
MRLPCPYCGTRDENEFVFGGPSHLERPGPEVDDATWTAYLYFRDNPVGIQCERWLHLYGCGRWFNLARNTLTHEILRSYRMADPKPVGLA